MCQHDGSLEQYKMRYKSFLESAGIHKNHDDIEDQFTETVSLKFVKPDLAPLCQNFSSLIRQ